MSLSGPIKHILESHKNGESGGDGVRPVDYWRKKVGRVAADNNNPHHIGKYYAKEGMKIDINSDHPQSRELASVMGFISGYLVEKKKASYAMDSLLETYIKAIAVSILSETNGNSAEARELLENGGMKLVKNFDVESMKNLLEQLKDISTGSEKKER